MTTVSRHSNVFQFVSHSARRNVTVSIAFFEIVNVCVDNRIKLSKDNNEYTALQCYTFDYRETKRHSFFTRPVFNLNFSFII